MMNCPNLFDNATEIEKEVADILLDLSSLSIEPVVPGWGFRAKRSALKKGPSLLMADHGVASQLETPFCDGENENENSNSKHGADDQHIPYIEENSSEIKVEPPSFESTTLLNPQHKVIKIKFNPFSEIHHTQKSIQIENKHSKLEADIHPKSVMITKKTYNKRAKEEFERGLDKVAVSKGHFVRRSRRIKAEPTTVQEANNVFVPRKKRAKRKSIEKVKHYLENRKTLNLQLKAVKQQVSHLRKALNLQLKAVKLQEEEKIWTRKS